jgi:ribosomal protein S4
MNSETLYRDLTYLRELRTLTEEEQSLIDLVLDLLEEIDAVPQFKEQVNKFLENRLENE